MNAALANLYYYQNPNTKQASSSAVSVKQLCRIICRKTSESASSSSSSSKPTFIDGSTSIIAYDPLTNSFDEGGWKTANTVPIFREALSSWHYEIIENSAGDGSVAGATIGHNKDTSIDSDSSATSKRAIKGPIDCRQLASLYYDEESQVWNETRVWSPHLEAWKKILEVPELINAFEAIDVAKPTPSFSSDPSIQLRISQSSATENTQGTDSKKNADESELDDFFTSTVDDNDDDVAAGVETGVQNFQETQFTEGSSSNKRKAQSKTADAIKSLTKKKKSKPKFKAKNAKNWVYVSGFPLDTNEKEVTKFFSKVGILDIDPESLMPKVKLYRQKKDGVSSLKGDATICYARPESVDLALQILDSTVFRTIDASGKFIKNGNIIKVQRAKFEQHGEEYKRKTKVSDVKRKVARTAKLQAVGWDEGENGFITGGLKGLRIIVLKHAFDTKALGREDKSGEDSFLEIVERDIKKTCQEFGTVEKITIFSGRKDGVVIVKFTQTTAASLAIEHYDGKEEGGRTIEAKFWDGVTDYTQRNIEKEAKDAETRLDSFGNWLDEQEVPDEFKLQVESF